MEQVKRYDSSNIDGTMEESEQGGYVDASDYDRLAADHARCMQDALAMARCVIMLCEANAKTDYASYAEAQRVLETWKED